jgi:hypothetical protein
MSWLNPEITEEQQRENAAARDHYDEAIAKPEDGPPRPPKDAHPVEPQPAQDELGIVGKVLVSLFIGVPIGIVWLGLVLWLVRIFF